MIEFCNLSIEFSPKSRDILHISNGYQWQDDVYFPAEPYRITALTSLVKTNEAAQYNYVHFTKIMAKMVQKYSDKIGR